MTIQGPIKQLLRWPADAYVRALLARQFRAQTSQPLNERPIEYAYVFQKIGQLAPTTVLDVGVGRSALPALMHNCGCVVWATDNDRDYWRNGVVNHHFFVINDDIRESRLTERFDLVTCISTLEHIREYDRAVASMARLLKRGGHLVMSFPYCEHQYVENAYALSGSRAYQCFPFITQIFSRVELNDWQRNHALVLTDQEFWRFFDGQHWSLGEPLARPEKVGVSEQHQLTCVTLRRND